MTRQRRIGSLLRSLNVLAAVTVAGSLAFVTADRAEAGMVSDYLIIGTGPGSAAVAGAISNFEIGANQTMLPATGCPGPGLSGYALDLPVSHAANTDAGHLNGLTRRDMAWTAENVPWDNRERRCSRRIDQETPSIHCLGGHGRSP